MRTIITAVILASVFSSAHAGVAFLKYERTSGMNKICFYDHLGSEVAITISAIALCPLTINV